MSKLYPRLNETAEGLYLEDGTFITWRDNEAYPFIYTKKGNVSIGINGRTHGSVPNKFYNERGEIITEFIGEEIPSGDIAGRIWIKHKIISFWDNPTKPLIKKIIRKLEKAFLYQYDMKINIWNDWSYRLNIWTDYNFSKDINKNEELLVNLRNYCEGKEEKAYYGSKSPKYQEKRKWQMASMTDEGQKEDLYPKLFENPDTINYYGEKYNFHINEAIPFLFGYEIYDWDEYKGEGPRIIFGERGRTHNSAYTKKENNKETWKSVIQGRLWLNVKVISFWEFPSREELKTIVKLIEQQENIKILGEGWKVDMESCRFPWFLNMSHGLKLDTNTNLVPMLPNFISVEEYIGNKPVIAGSGSKNPNYLKKRQWQMANLSAENKKEELYPKLFEDPDTVEYKNEFFHWTDNDAIPFGYIGDKMEMGSFSRSHENGGIPRTKMGAGRIWVKGKIISFWVYPQKNEFEKVIHDLEKALKENTEFDIDIWNDPEFKVEVLKGFNPKNVDQTSYSKYSEGDWDYNIIKGSKLIPIKQYVGSKQRSKKELAIQHLDTTHKHKVPYGFGSKNPKYLEHRRWQMANAAEEGKKENLYPRLNEEIFADLEKNVKKEEKEDILNKRVIKVLKDAGNEDVKVCLINGDYVRGKNPGLNFDGFVDGGHHYVTSLPGYKKWIPEDEIWIDDVFEVKPHDLRAILQHEYTERNLMKYKKHSYDDAHEYANKKESSYREKNKK